MSIESIDFQPFVHQQVTQLIDLWGQAGFSEEEIQETASQFYNMGCIAFQQMQQEGSIQPQGSTQQIPYTPDMAQKIITYFLKGLHVAILKFRDEAIQAEQKQHVMQYVMQQVAYHVFEQGKQIAIATLNQENTPEIQISEEQINGWLGQTASEALIYYINEYEKQYGPIKRVNIPELPSILEEDESLQKEHVTQLSEGLDEAVPEKPDEIENKYIDQSQTIPEIHHKYAAIGLFLNTLPVIRQKTILSTFSPDAQKIIKKYQNPEIVASKLDLQLVAKYLKQFKEKIGSSKIDNQQSKYASAAAQFINALPPQRMEELFKHERPLVRSYVSQFINDSSKDTVSYNLPSGVEESLILYLDRNFPQAASS